MRASINLNELKGDHMLTIHELPPTAKRLYWSWLEPQALAYIRNNDLNPHNVGVCATSVVYELEHNLGDELTTDNIADAYMDFGNYPNTFYDLTYDMQWVVCYTLASQVY